MMLELLALIFAIKVSMAVVFGGQGGLHAVSIRRSRIGLLGGQVGQLGVR